MKENGKLGNWRTSGDHPNYSIIENGPNTENPCKLEETCCHSKSSEKPSARTDVKNSNEQIIIIIITSGDHPNDTIIKNGQNTEKSPGDLRRLSATQTPVEDYQLALM